LRRIAHERERILIAPTALELTGVGEQQPRLPDEIEREVGERQVLLERGCMADPLREALAQHERGVREAQHVLAARLLLRLIANFRRSTRGAHRFFTSSGIS